MRWICTSCGGPAEPSAARPSLDERYGVGYCERCTPVPIYDPKTQKTTPVRRSTVPLVQESHWNPALLTERAERKREAKLIRDALAGKFRDDSKELAEYREIMARHEAEAEARRGPSAA